MLVIHVFLTAFVWLLLGELTGSLLTAILLFRCLVNIHLDKINNELFRAYRRCHRNNFSQLHKSSNYLYNINE